MAVTWTNTIKDFFTQYEIDHMKIVSKNDPTPIDLSSYASVKARIDDIWGMIGPGYMPPSWPNSNKTAFKQWMDNGMTQAAWQSTVKPLFNEFDIEHMKQITGNALKLDDYDSTKIWAGQIWDQVSNGYMPPGAWPQPKRDTFKAWMDAGMPE